MSLKTNVHVHFFTADHSPPIQVYYLLHQTIRDAIEDFVPGHQDVNGPDFIARLDAFEAPFRAGLQAAILASSVAPGLLRSAVAGLVRVLTHCSAVEPAVVRQIFGQPAAPLHLSAAALLRRVGAEIDAVAAAGHPRPFQAALAGLVNRLYAAQDKALSQGKRVRQQDLLAAFDLESRARYQRLVALSVNFDHAFAGKSFGIPTAPRLDFDHQIAELASLAQAVNQGPDPTRWRLLPFLGLDPRHRRSPEELCTWVADQLVPNGVFCGLKLYPPMRVDPADPRLEPIWDLCQDRAIPVTSHCGAGGGGVRDERRCGELAHPDQWRPVLERLSRRKQTLQAQTGRFKLCLAHFSDLERRDVRTWSDEIMELMETYREGIKIYADLAYSKPRHNRMRFKSNLRRLARRDLLGHVLPGSDWWNLYPDFTDENHFLEELHLDGATSDWWDLRQLDDNAAEFLFA